MKTKNILLFASPSSGKSMLAALIFGQLKLRNKNAALVMEYAKDKIYEGLDMKSVDVNTELDILVNQTKRELLVRDKVDYMVSDSPLLLNAYYSHNDYAKNAALAMRTPLDFYFWIPKDISIHENEGRSHNLDDSIKISVELKKFLNDCGIQLIEVNGPVEKRADWIIDYVLNNS